MNQLEKLEQAFLKKHTAEDIYKPVTGLLKEYSCKHGTVFYGNGEAILSPVDDTEEELTLFVDNYNGKLIIVRG